MKNWVYAIEWDLNTDQFLIKSPKNVFGGVIETRVDMNDFR